APVIDELGLGPAGMPQPPFEVIEHAVSDGNAKRRDRIAHVAVSPAACVPPANQHRCFRETAPALSCPCLSAAYPQAVQCGFPSHRKCLLHTDPNLWITPRPPGISARSIPVLAHG